MYMGFKSKCSICINELRLNIIVYRYNSSTFSKYSTREKYVIQTQITMYNVYTISFFFLLGFERNFKSIG